MPNPMEAWVVNPTNGHIYKKIRCKRWEDARATATAEGAHLVSINDEAEQKWLVETFGEETVFNRADSSGKSNRMAVDEW